MTKKKTPDHPPYPALNLILGAVDFAVRDNLNYHPVNHPEDVACVASMVTEVVGSVFTYLWQKDALRD